MLQSNLCDYNDVLLFPKGLLVLQDKMLMYMTRSELLQIMHQLLVAFQKLIIHLLTMQKIQIL